MRTVIYQLKEKLNDLHFMCLLNLIMYALSPSSIFIKYEIVYAKLLYEARIVFVVIA